MKRRINAGLLTLLCTASAVLAGCGGENFRSSIDGNSSSEVGETSAAADSSLPEEIPELTPSESRSSEAYDGSGAAESVAETAVTETSALIEEPPRPRAAENYSVDAWYGFSVSGFELVYSNDELKKCFDKLQEICTASNFSMSFSYKNVNTGAYIGYNPYNKFMTCSTIKAPVVKSLLAEGIDLDTEIERTYTWDGDYDGFVAKSPYGTVFTAGELIEHTIIESDNSAYYMLCRTFGTSAFNQMQYQLGSNYTLGYNAEWIFTQCTSDDMMKDYEDIYKFGRENEQGAWLIDLMCHTNTDIQIGAALKDKYEVAQKYGSEFNEVVFNDCAIVYADSPFVLCILTKQYPETEQSCKVFKDLALVFDEINSLIADPTLGEIRMKGEGEDDESETWTESFAEAESEIEPLTELQTDSKVYSMDNAWW